MAELGVHESALLTDLALCVNRWRLFSPGWYVCVLTRVQLSAEEWEVPGLVAMVNYGRKKQCEVRDEVFHGPPNFVLDVFDDAADETYLRRRDRFSRYGVHEYVAILNDDPKASPGIGWMPAATGRLSPTTTGSSGARRCPTSGSR